MMLDCLLECPLHDCVRSRSSIWVKIMLCTDESPAIKTSSQSCLLCIVQQHGRTNPLPAESCSKGTAQALLMDGCFFTCAVWYSGRAESSCILYSSRDDVWYHIASTGTIFTASPTPPPANPSDYVSHLKSHMQVVYSLIMDCILWARDDVPN